MSSRELQKRKRQRRTAREVPANPKSFGDLQLNAAEFAPSEDESEDSEKHDAFDPKDSEASESEEEEGGIEELRENKRTRTQANKRLPSRMQLKPDELDPFQYLTDRHKRGGVYYPRGTPRPR
ncbi:hypothetical protein EJ08DRAFT_666777 [Tothia fuscella]|uniref:Uncharacterized protein n=1 Tax=Tothia fuscella TaxID=1048955 RepID=A0A9P4NDU0_9PEZI|nr:hypothetical protein EJ08DRAFT_666777 [Tothia fuscella]